jgi:hypothetical protein
MAEMEVLSVPESGDSLSDALIKSDALVKSLAGQSLLDLPAETRFEIYKHVLAGVRISLTKKATVKHTAKFEARIPKGDHAESRRDKSVKIKKGDLMWNDMGLTLVAHLIREEFLSVFASTKSLHLIGQRRLPLNGRSLEAMLEWYLRLVREISMAQDEVR